MSKSILNRESLAVTVRHFHAKDVASVLDTESATPRPWDEKTLVRYSQDRHGIVKVAEMPERHYVVGHLCVRICERTPLSSLAYSSNLRIDKVAVKPGFRQQGVGQRLLREAVDIGKRIKLPVAFPIRETDLPSQLWLRARGWFCYRIARDYLVSEQAYWFAPNEEHF